MSNRGPVPEGDESRSDGQAPPIPDKGELKYPNLGSRLDELVTGVEVGEITAEEAAGSAAMHQWRVGCRDLLLVRQRG